MNNRQRAQILCRADLYYFIIRCFTHMHPAAAFLPNWHIKLIAEHLMDLESGKNKRLMILIAPRQLKSFCANIVFPAWVLGRDPSKKIICVSYSEELAEDFSRKTREIMESQWYKDTFPSCRINPKRKSTGMEFHTSKGGMRLAASTAGTLTGRGGDYIIIDDPIKAQEAHSEAVRERCINFYHDTLYSRLDNKNEGRICLVMQRLHMNDLAGHLMQQSGWTIEKLPAIATEDEKRRIRGVPHVRLRGEALHPERESLGILETTRQTMLEHHFEAQYQQNPVPPGGNIIKREWFHYYRNLPQIQDQLEVIQSWDTASKTSDHNDYSVCTTWVITRKNAYLAHVYRGRHEYPELKQKILSMRDEYQANRVLIEDASSGTQLLQEFSRQARGWLLSASVDGTKQQRIEGCSAIIAEGGLLFPHDAPWLECFRDELLAFPNGNHDDQADSLAHFVRYYLCLRDHYSRLGPNGRTLTKARSQGRVRRPSMRAGYDPNS